MVLAAIRGDTSYGSRWQDRCGGRLESSEAKAGVEEGLKAQRQRQKRTEMGTNIEIGSID